MDTDSQSYFFLPLTYICELIEEGLIQTFWAPQATCIQKYVNDRHEVNNFCVLLLQVIGVTPPSMSVHPIHARTALRAWITSMSSNVFVKKGGQAKDVMWT